MSTTEPPEGSTPPPAEPTPPPPPPAEAAAPPPPAAEAAAPPPPAGSAPPPPPPPPAPAGAPGMAPPAAAGVPRPGELMDRFLARLIDFAILLIPILVLNFILRAIFLNGFTYSIGEYLLYYLFFSVLQVAIEIGYFAYFESSRGQTVGKQVMKLQTFGPDGVSHPTMEQSVRRNIWLAAALLAIIPIIGWFLSPIASIASIVLIVIGINNVATNRKHWFDEFAGGTQVMKIG